MGATTPKQVAELVEKGFSEAARVSDGDFESHAGQPESKSGILVVSELLIPIPVQCKLLGIDNRLTLDQLATHANTVPLPKRLLYWCYGIDDGRAMKGFSPEQAIQKLSDSKRFPAHTALVLAIFRMDIQVINGNHRIDIGGSRIEGGLAPVLLLANGHPATDHPVLSSAPLSAAGKPTYGMASFEKAK